MTNGKILIVDDNLMNIELLVETFDIKGITDSQTDIKAMMHGK